MSIIVSKYSDSLNQYLHAEVCLKQIGQYSYYGKVGVLREKILNLECLHKK